MNANEIMSLAEELLLRVQSLENRVKALESAAATMQK